MNSRKRQQEDNDDEPVLPSLSYQRDSSPILPPLPNAALSCVSPLSSRKRPFRATDENTAATTVIAAKIVRNDSVDDDQLAAAFNTSSDPAFFSSDETPDVENYSDSKRRKKKVYSGTWWGKRLRPTASRQSLRIRKVNAQKDRTFRRNFDSGIFMGDDSTSAASTDLSSDGLVEELKANSRPTRKTGLCLKGGEDLSSDSIFPGCEEVAPPQRKFKIADPAVKLSSEKKPGDVLVDDRVEGCLERGSPDVDLTGLGIEDLPPTITQLNALVKQIPRASGEFTDLSLQPRIYLGNNNLSRFPSQLLNIPRVELLSIRQNLLQELPDEIVKLTHLKELNVAGNRLDHLPFGILRLFDCHQLQEIQSEPNEWRKMPSRENQVADFPLLVHNRGGYSIRRVAVAPAIEYAANGKEQIKHAPVGDLQLQAPQRTRSPFLSEMVLRSLAKLTHPATDLSQVEEVEDCPDNVKDMLHALHKYQYNGKHECTFCGRHMILSRFTWLEWWTRSRRNDVPEYEAIIVRPRFEILTNDDALKSEDDESEVSKDDEPVMAADEAALPYIRRSCGCRTQREGLQEERKLYERVIQEGQYNVSMSPAQSEDKKRFEWPRLC